MGLRRGIDVLAARRELGLSVTGLAHLLRMDSKHANTTIQRWQEKQLDPPGAVEVLLEVLLRSPEARRVAGVDELARKYPFAGRDGEAAD